MKCRRMLCRIVIILPLLHCLTACGDHSAAPLSVSMALESTITGNALVAHAKVLESVSLGNALSRSASSPGYIQAMDYIKAQLAGSGLKVWDQRFDYQLFYETQNPVLSMISPEQAAYVWGTDYQTMTYSGNGDVTADIVFITPVFPPGVTANTSSDGCEDTDFQDIDVAGKIAIIQRGSCAFSVKALNAQSRGAAAVLIFNEGQDGRTDIVIGALSPSSTMKIPVVGVRYDLGEALYKRYAAGTAVAVRVAVTAMNTRTVTYNLFAETTAGRTDQTIVMGAHLDSVVEGPGINDNGSGSVALLEVARQIGITGYTPRNRIRFAWWGAEEVGTLGSLHYLNSLTSPELQSIAMYLNIDCIASHNFVRGVEDSDLSDTRNDPSTAYKQTPAGSGAIEQALLDYFHAHNLPTMAIPPTGRTDYDAFVQQGIPFGSLFTGLDGIKTTEEALLFGGTAGQPYDAFYHTAHDTVANMNTQVFTENTKAIAHFAQYFGDRQVTALPVAAGYVAKRTVTVETTTPDLDRYHKDRQHRPTR